MLAGFVCDGVLASVMVKLMTLNRVESVHDPLTIVAFVAKSMNSHPITRAWLQPFTKPRLKYFWFRISRSEALHQKNLFFFF